MLQLLSTDFDGTLVNHDVKPAVVPDLFRALRELKESGMKWLVNTGRSLWHLDDGLKREFKFPIEPDFAIVEERDIYSRTRDGGWAPLDDWNGRAYRDHTELFHLATPLLAEILAFMEVLEGSEAVYDRGRFVGAVTRTVFDMDRLCIFLDKLGARLPLFSYQRNSIYVRFCHNAYSKGTALGELARQLGVERDHIMATGDHHNDLAMLDGRFAALVACPGNSCEEVKTAVRTAGGFLANGHASEGVVEAMRHFKVWGT
jgi:hypothetical protein